MSYLYKSITKTFSPLLKTKPSSPVQSSPVSKAMDTIILSMLASAAPFLLALLTFLILLEQITYLRKKRSLPGPLLILPFLGNAIPLIRTPTKFWQLQASWAKSSGSELSTNYLFGNFILFIRSTELSHRVFGNVRPDAFQIIGHPLGKKLFGEHNLIYMLGQSHKDLRRRIAPNFTNKALSTYLSLQQQIIVRHLEKWEEMSSSGRSKPVSLRLLCRDLNLDTSQTVFVGPHLSLEERKAFNYDYSLFNAGLMSVPVDFPGFAFREARLSVDRLVETLSGCAARSKAKIRAGSEPTCLVDYWMEETVKEITAAEKSGGAPPPFSDDLEVGGHLFDFLFAAQDASTSSLLWAITLLESHPEVLARVRAEVSGIWKPESYEMIKAEQLREMKYTEAVAREVIRFRPPATLVPHVALKDFPLTESYTVPKGTIVFPSLLESSFQGFADSERFDPDRFMEKRREDQVYRRNYLAFGAGSHQCVGQRYALNHLSLFIALFVSLLDFKRHRTDGCDELSYVPTIAPKDDCLVYLSRRCGRFPAF